MQRRSFLGATVAAGLALSFADVQRAAADPVDVVAHPRLLLHDWDGVIALIAADDHAAAWYAKIKTDADSILTRPVGEYVIPDGKRLLDTSRETLRRVYSLGFAYGVDGDTAHLDRLWAELEAVAEFPDWNDQLHFLDTAEMTHAVALGYDWFYEHWTAEQRATLERAIKDFGLSPGIDCYEGRSPSAWWTSVTNNWNIVCNGGMIVGALALADVEPELCQQVIDYAMEGLPPAIAEYGPDGGYPEGLGSYWGYATKYLVLLIEAFRTATGQDHGLVDSPGLSTTGAFPIQLTGPTGYNFNYYDAGNSTPRPPELFWLARTYQRPEFGWLGVQGADNDPPSWTQSATSLLWYDPELSKDPIQAETALDSYFGRCEVATMRSGWESTEATFLGTKAGDNTTNHGNLDLGTFVLDALGYRWASELGGDDYNLPGYFDAGEAGLRWTYYRNRAEGQNTVLINPGTGLDQAYTATGKIVRRESGPAAALAIADLAEAHPQLSSWRRGWRLFDQRRQLIVQDELSCSDASAAWWFLHTSAEITIAADGRSATLVSGVNRVVARIASPAKAVFCTADARPLWTSPDPDGQNANTGIRKLAIRLTEVTDLQLTVQFTPLNPDEPLAVLEGVIDLDAWATGPDQVATLSTIVINGEPLQNFAANNFTYHVDLTSPIRVTAEPTDRHGRVKIIHPERTTDGSIQIHTSAPGRPTSIYRLFEKVTVRPGSFPATIVASADDGNVPVNTMDGDLNTRWSASGDGQWIAYDMGADGALSEIDIAWHSGDTRQSIFSIEVAAADETTWHQVYEGRSSGSTTEPETYTFSPTSARYLRIVGHGNTANAWNSISEVTITGRTVELPTVDPYLAELTVDVAAVHPGGTSQVDVHGTLNDGSTADLADLDIEYVSSEPAVATIDNAGRLSGVTEGKTIVAAIVVTADRRLVYGRAEVTVTDPLRPRIVSSADAYVRDGAQADTNFGTVTNMLVKSDGKTDTGFNRQTYLSFPGADLAGTVESVSLLVRAHVADNNGTEIDIDVCGTGPFDEGAITWNTKPAIGDSLASVHVTSEAEWRVFDVTAGIAEAVQAGEPVDLVLAELLPPGTNGLAVHVASRESANAPYLQVQLTG